MKNKYFLILSILYFLILDSLEKPTEPNISDEIVEEDPEDTKRIHGGSPATPKLFPYIVSIQFKKETKFVKFCGGSIVAPNWILTAAHCCRHIKDKNGDDQTYVRGGVIEAFATTPGYQLIQVNKYFIHEAYNNYTFQHDICLLKLYNPFEYTEHVKKIEMAPRCKAVGNRGYISGFGRLDQNHTTEQLNYAEMELMDIYTILIGFLKVCLDYFPHALKNYHVCPGAKDKSSCKGDSGSPFTQIDAKGEPCLVGLSSFSRKKCQDAEMAAYIKVEAYINWIDDTMAENS